jgi:hypothetical protein
MWNKAREEGKYLSLLSFSLLDFLVLSISLEKRLSFETSLRMVAACKYGYINQLQG